MMRIGFLGSRVFLGGVTGQMICARESVIFSNFFRPLANHGEHRCINSSVSVSAAPKPLYMAIHLEERYPVALFRIPY